MGGACSQKLKSRRGLPSSSGRFCIGWDAATLTQDPIGQQKPASPGLQLVGEIHYCWGGSNLGWVISAKRPSRGCSRQVQGMEATWSAFSSYPAPEAHQVSKPDVGWKLECDSTAAGEATTDLGRSIHPLRGSRSEFFRTGQLRRNEPSGRSTTTGSGAEAGVRTPCSS